MQTGGQVRQAVTCFPVGKHSLQRRCRLLPVAAANGATAGGRNRTRRRAPARDTGPSRNIAVTDLAERDAYSPYRRAPPTDTSVRNSEAGWNGQDAQHREQPGGSRQPGGSGQPSGRESIEANVDKWGLAVPANGRTQRTGRSSQPVNDRTNDRQAGRRAPDSWAHDESDSEDTLEWGAPSPSQIPSEGQAPHRSPSNSRSERLRSDQPVDFRQNRSDLSPAGERPSSRGSRETWGAVRGDPWSIVHSGDAGDSGDSKDSRSAAGRTARRVAEDGRDSWGSRGGVSECAQGSRQNMQDVHRRPYILRKEKVRLMLQSNADIKAAYGDLTRALEESSTAQNRALALKEFLEELRAIVESGADHFDPVNVSTAFYQLAAALSDCSGSLSDEIAAEAAELSYRLVTLSLIQVKEFKIGAVFNTVSSLAKLATIDQDRLLASLAKQETLLGDLLEGLAGQALARFRELPPPEPQYLAGLMWAYGKLGVNPLGGRLFAVVLTVSEPLLEGFAPQNLSNLLVAAENLKEPLSAAFLERLAQQVVLKMPEASPQGVSNSLWAFAKLTGASPLQGDLFRAGFSRALEDSKRFNIQNVANLLWAAATVEQTVSRTVLDSLAQAALADIDNAVPQNVSNLLWACAKLDVKPLDGSLIEAALAKADQLLPRLSRQELSNSIWALGHLEHSIVSQRMLQRLNGPWAERALALLSQRADDVSVSNGRRETREGWAQHVGNIMWAYSRLRLDPLQGRLAIEVGALVEHHILEFTTQNLSNLLLAAATLQRPCLSAAALEKISAAIASKGNRQEVCNTLWSLAAMGSLDQAILRRMGARLLELDAPATLSLPEAKQLLLAELSVQLSASGSKAEGALLPDALTNPARQLVPKAGEEARISEFHEEVSAALKSMHVPHAIEFASPDGMFSIDIVAKAGDGAPLAIEVDGAHHFTALPPFRPLGNTVLRNRLLSGKGFRGLGIPFYDWERLRGAGERRRYLESRLAKHGVKPQGQKQTVKAA